MVRAAKFRREHVEASEFTVKPLKTGRKKDSGQEVRPGPGRHATKSKSRRPKANVCYHCGSSEHLSFECSEEHDFRFARCLRCRQCGHFAHDCPEDANQVLKSAPVEGPCEFCSSIEHSSKECRPLQLGMAPSQIISTLTADSLY